MINVVAAIQTQTRSIQFSLVSTCPRHRKHKHRLGTGVCRGDVTDTAAESGILPLPPPSAELTGAALDQWRGRGAARRFIRVGARGAAGHPRRGTAPSSLRPQLSTGVACSRQSGIVSTAHRSAAGPGRPPLVNRLDGDTHLVWHLPGRGNTTADCRDGPGCGTVCQNTPYGLGSWVLGN